MSLMNTGPLTWVVVTLDREVAVTDDQLRVFQAFDSWAVSVEDLVSSAVFQLNSRDRPIIIDHLLNLYDPDERRNDTLCEFLTSSISLIYNHLAAIVPGNMEVQEYVFVGEDIMIGGMLF